jgi:phage FluMu protein Com
LTTEKHTRIILNAPKLLGNAPKLPVNAPIRAEQVPRNPLACVYCDKVFTHKPSMQRHMNHRCKKNKQLNLIKQQQETIEIQKKHIETQKKILTQRPNHTINNTTNNTTNNTVNIQNNYILPYKDTDTSHLTTKDYAFCVKQPDGVKRLIEKIHFNPMKPENQNLTITNLTDKYMMVYDGTQWKKVLKSELNKIYNQKESLLEEWVEQDPVLKEKFYEYIKTERKDVHLERIEAIKLMMYNQKTLAIV